MVSFMFVNVLICMFLCIVQYDWLGTVFNAFLVVSFVSPKRFCNIAVVNNIYYCLRKPGKTKTFLSLSGNTNH